VVEYPNATTQQNKNADVNTRLFTTTHKRPFRPHCPTVGPTDNKLQEGTEKRRTTTTSVAVGVVLHGHLAPRLLEVIVGGVTLDTKQRVVVLAGLGRLLLLGRTPGATKHPLQVGLKTPTTGEARVPVTTDVGR
jgi:hypothetical protein